MRPVEFRVYHTEFEARAVGDEFRIAGHAAVFDKFSQDLGGFVERIARGAFKKTIREADVRALFNHDPNFVLGRYLPGRADNTLRISEDANGLHYEVTLGNQSYARDLYESIQRGDVTQSSFAFRTIDDSWSRTDEGYPMRTLTQVSLHNGDVSPVTYPAYEQTDIAVRAMARAAQREGLPIEELAAALRSGKIPNEVRDDEQPVAVAPAQLEEPAVDLSALRIELLRRRISPA
jgi:HK97 family phage prohead protease